MTGLPQDSSRVLQRLFTGQRVATPAMGYAPLAAMVVTATSTYVIVTITTFDPTATFTCYYEARVNAPSSGSRCFVTFPANDLQGRGLVVAFVGIPPTGVGVDVTGTPTAGQIPVATSGTTGEWATPLAKQLHGIAGAVVRTTQTTTSTSYTNLAIVGPSVTVSTGTRALVFLTAQVGNPTVAYSIMSYAISGPTTVTASDTWTLSYAGKTNLDPILSSVILHTGLTPGNNTFTCKYRVTSGTGRWQRRRIAVIPLP